MDLETALLHLQFEEITYSTEYFRTYRKGNDTLFVFMNARGEKNFSDFSGEFTGNIDDFLVHYYISDIGSKLNEEQRLKKFYEEYQDVDVNFANLTAVRSFNLFNIILEKGVNYNNLAFNNVKAIGDKLHFMIMDDEKTNNPFNVLGVISYDLKTRSTEVLNFSKMDRGIYFSNPNVPAKSCIIFSNLADMLYFEKTYSKENYFYIMLPTQSFSYSQSKTLKLLLKGKAIEKVILAFPNTTEGMILDYQYLSTFYDYRIKEKAGSIKIEIPQSANSDKFVLRMKDLRNSLTNGLKKRNISIELLTIKTGVGINQNPTFVIEIPKVANILRAVLTLIKQYLLQGEEINIIKPENENWNPKGTQKQEVLENPLKHKIILSDIRETYSFN